MNQDCTCSEGRREREQEVLDEMSKMEKGNDVQEVIMHAAEF